MPKRAPTGPVRAKTGNLDSGTLLWRVHSSSRGALQLNPTVPAPDAGGRFDTDDGSYSYLYLGDSVHAAVAETFVRALPLDGAPRIFRARKLVGRAISQVEVVDTVPVALLHGSRLNHVGQDTWLTKCDPVDYPLTRAWARCVLEGTPAAQGIAYRCRNDEDRFAYLLVVRGAPVPCDFPGLKETGARLELDSDDGRELLNAVLPAYNAVLAY